MRHKDDKVYRERKREKLHADREVVAYHEAGHAVAAWCLHVQLRRASIVPDATDSSAGHVLHRRMNRRSCADVELGERFVPARLRAEKIVMISIAGRLAQYRFDPNSLEPHHGEGDRESETDILIRYAARGADGIIDSQPYAALLQSWTRELVEGNWDLIEAVADALLRAGAMSGREVHSVILDSFNKRYPNLPPITLRKTRVQGTSSRS